MLFGIFFPFWYVVPRKIWQPCFPNEAESFRMLNVYETIRLDFKPKKGFASFDENINWI
jgi:hypothetical protein